MFLAGPAPRGAGSWEPGAGFRYASKRMHAIPHDGSYSAMQYGL